MFPLPPFPLCTSLREPTASAPRGATLGTRINRDIFLIMPLRFVRQLRTQTAQSLVLSVKLDARYGHRLAIPVPSAKLQIPCTSSLRIRYSCCSFCNSCTLFYKTIPQNKFAKSNKFDKQNQECLQDLWEMLVFCSKSLIQNFLFLCKN